MCVCVFVIRNRNWETGQRVPPADLPQEVDQLNDTHAHTHNHQVTGFYLVFFISSTSRYNALKVPWPHRRPGETWPKWVYRLVPSFEKTRYNDHDSPPEMLSDVRNRPNFGWKQVFFIIKKGNTWPHKRPGETRPKWVYRLVLSFEKLGTTITTGLQKGFLVCGIDRISTENGYFFF